MDEVTNEQPITDLSHLTNEQIDRFVKEQLYQPSTLLTESDALKREAHWIGQPQPKPNGYGVSVAMLAWSLAFLLFPKFVLSPMWLTYVFYAVGFVALLIGILGISIEIFKGKP